MDSWVGLELLNGSWICESGQAAGPCPADDACDYNLLLRKTLSQDGFEREHVHTRRSMVILKKFKGHSTRSSKCPTAMSQGARKKGWLGE